MKHHYTKPQIADQSDDKMQEANNNGINVVPQLSSDESDNIKAKFVLKNTINEDENPDLIIRQSDQDLLMINKKTGYGFFAHFD